MLMKRSRARLVIPAVALSLALSACSGGGDEGGGTDAEGGAGTPGGGSFSVYIGEPENPLVPGDTGETEGGQIVDSLWTGLITYNPDTYEVEYDGVAESIESQDSRVWTIRLKDGWTFHDGTPVNAQSYVDAWNYTAYSPNAQGNSYFFSNVEGYEALQAETDDAGNIVTQPAAQQLSGLRAVDDRTVEVTLSQPFAQYPITLGYTAFFPLPPAFFTDQEGFGSAPIGNGPFRVPEGTTLDPTRGITLERYEEYAGDTPAQAQSVEFRIYTEDNTAYNDVLAGNLDVVDIVPPDAIETARQQFGERFVEREAGDITVLGFPNFDPRYSDPNVKKAISLAIDREAITEAIFGGSREAVGDWISPIIDGYREDACEFVGFDPQRARQLLDQSGFDRSRPIELWFNAGAGHEEWMQAIGNQLRENLGVDFVLRGDLQFAQYLPLGDERGFTGPHRAGWIMDYPSPQNFLEPLYGTAALPPAGSNNFWYSNPEFDQLITQGNSAPDNDTAIQFYQQAGDILCRDMPSTPLFSRVNQTVHSERVEGVYTNAFGRVPVAEVRVVQE